MDTFHTGSLTNSNSMFPKTIALVTPFPASENAPVAMDL